MSVQSLFLIIMMILSSIGVYGAISLQVFDSNNIGPGFMPLMYSCALMICSLLLFVKKSGIKRINLPCLLNKPGFDSLFFFIMTIVCYIMVGLIGMLPALFLYSFIVLVQQKRMNVFRIIIFEAIFMIIIYFLFVKILNVPFENGLILG